MRNLFLLVSAGMLAAIGVAAHWETAALWALAVVGPIIAVGVWDIVQTRHTIRRNFPIVGHFRYFFEAIRPEINQYFIESNSDGVPFSREQRSVVYQRAKRELDTLPFGTQHDVYAPGYEWASHSLAPVHVDPHGLRVSIGGSHCSQPYSASILNVSAMSYGALSRTAVMALGGGAKLGGFAQNTGEGGLTEYHLEPGGDLIWQIGTGYFGCRSETGQFSPERFAERACLPSVKMIEIKLSQGAKPSHGGILPAAKVTAEIAAIRGVPMGKDVISPPAHSAFSNPLELLAFVQRLRELSGGKPVGFKLCIGKRSEFIAVAKAMRESGLLPDFITVDGGEGGTGAAPLEFSNSIGFPLHDALVFVRNVLVGMNLRDQIRIVASGRTVTGFDLLTKFALGADLCNAARAMMMAIGCIQALRCNSNRCPTGVATQNPALYRGLNVADKRVRVANYHMETVKSAAELMGAMGLARPADVKPWHIHRRTGIGQTGHYGEIYEFLPSGALLDAPPPAYAQLLESATADSFTHANAH
jgi:glutamate synthase domain-containing protein 2